MQTINAGYIKPAGYSADYIEFVKTPCERHGEYSPFCGRCDYVERIVRVGLGGDILALILDREDSSLIEWITKDTSIESAANFATWGNLVVCADVWNLPEIPDNISAAMYEAKLYSDCFGVNV